MDALGQSSNVFDRLGSLMEAIYEPNKKVQCGLDDLNDIEADALAQAFGMLIGDRDIELDTDHLFDVKTDDCGMVDRIYAAGLGLNSAGDGVAVLSGSNEFPATCTPNGIICGDVTFSVIVDSESKTTTIGDQEYEIFPAKCEGFVEIDGEQVSLEMPVLISAKTPHTKPILVNAFKSDSKAIEFLRRPMAFGNTYSSAELGIGSFPLVGVKFLACEGKNGKYPRAIGQLASGDEVWLDGSISTQILNKRWQPISGKTLLSTRTETGWELKDKSRPVHLNVVGLEEYENRSGEMRVRVKGNVSVKPLPSFAGFTALPGQKATAPTPAIAPADDAPAVPATATVVDETAGIPF